MGETTVCIDDELPFDIPCNWAWTQLKSVISLLSGQDMTPDCYADNEGGIPYLTGASNIENEKVIINRWTIVPRAIAMRGDLLITCKGTVGAMAFLECEQAHIARQFMAMQVGKALNKHYLKHFIESYVSILQNAAKSMIPGISRDDILNAFIPLPPISEQARIVTAIQSAFEKLQLIQ